MRLLWFSLHGYRRFEERADINLDGRLLAIVGPNEAGKSSVLQALTHLNHEEPFGRGELTRREQIPDDQEVIRARFLLEPADVEAITHLHGGGQARWFLLTKYPDGELATSIEPALTRDLRPREQAVTEAEKLARKLERIKKGQEPVPDDEEHLTSQVLWDLAEALKSTEESLDKTTRDQLSTVITQLREWSGDSSASWDKAIAVFGTLSSEESSHPDDDACALLLRRRPSFLSFGSAERELASAYDLSSDLVALPPTSALRNLAALAELDLDRVRDAVANEDPGLVDDLVDVANQTLAAKFRVSWRQSEIAVRFKLDEMTLRILIRTPNEASSAIDERSDGMRAFIALMAYTAVKAGATPPILLIDEAETHLHCQAQADLVQVLTEQTAASQIIYTTHSPACLPEDLGTSVRIVIPLEGRDRSTVQNSFWTDEPGFSPLLQAMGYAASALAFTPTRFAVFAEGPTELILLPVLLREAAERRALDFQVAPGLALVNRAIASRLELEAARVKYVVDSDQGGRDIRRVLVQAGVNEKDIFTLSDGADDGLTIEDFIDLETYRLAVNEELRRSHGAGHEIARGLIPEERGRVAFLEGWSAEQGISAPNKVKVAERIVELRNERSLVSRKRRGALKKLYGSLRDSLGIET
ncbi:MAG: AAA family ATPase [Gaiellaceae bacterium]|jgi:predicted ATP-dependent endonuclease of OLD family